MNHMVNRKTILTKFIIMSLDIDQKSIANDLHISQAQVSRLITALIIITTYTIPFAY